MPITTDPNDPRLQRQIDTEPTPPAPVYLVAPQVSEEFRAKTWKRPFRDRYIHVGDPPKHPLRPLTQEEQHQHRGLNYVSYETYPPERYPLTGRYWTAANLRHSQGCKGQTLIAREIAETFAKDPGFYSATYCSVCRKHRPLSEFAWEDGTTLGS